MTDKNRSYLPGSGGMFAIEKPDDQEGLDDEFNVVSESAQTDIISSEEPHVSAPIRRLGTLQHAIIDEEIDQKAEQALTNQPKQVTKRKRSDIEKVSLTTAIDKDLHARLRIYSFRTHKPLRVIIEELINQHCPE